MRRFLCDSHKGWHFFFEYHLRKCLNIPDGIETAIFLQQGSLVDVRIKKLPPFYRLVVTAWKRIGAVYRDNKWVIPGPSEEISLSDLSASKAYQCFLNAVCEPHRCIEKYIEFGFVSLDWPSIWSSLKLWRFIRSVRDTNWLIFHASLPTKDRLIRFGMSVDPLCVCGVNETLLHLFLECPTAVRLIDWFLSFYKLYDPGVNKIDSKTVLFGLVHDRSVPSCFSALLGILRHGVWVMRNSSTFDNSGPDIAEGIHAIKSTFRFLLRHQKRHCTQ